MRSPREDFEAAGKRLPWDAAARSAALSATAPVSDVKASANGTDNASNAEHSDDMPTVPIPARKAATTFDTPSKRERIEVKPPITRFIRRAVTRVFGVWSRISTQVVRQWDWYPRVEPYVGYGTGDYSRLICRTVYAPRHAQSGELIRGIRGMLAIPAPRTHVQASIDDMPLNTVQIGVSEVYDKVDRTRDLGSEYAISDSAGYLDLVAEHRLVPGIHRVSYSVANRKPVSANLYTIPASAKVGIISDVDDTIDDHAGPGAMEGRVQPAVPRPQEESLRAGHRACCSPASPTCSPAHRSSIFRHRPWNVESSIRNFITDHGFPEGPLLLRDLDPRPKTFVPTGPQHKLEFAEQLMADFPDMKFILVGDDGQKDPTTYATIARRYPGRVLAIVIRELSPRESTGLASVTGLTSTQPTPVTDVPVFTGTTGSNILKTMLPYLKTVLR